MKSIKSLFDEVFNLFRNNEHKTGEEVLKIIVFFITYYKIQEHITDDDISDMQEKLDNSDIEELRPIKAKWMRFDTLYMYLSKHHKKATEYYDAVIGFCLKNSRFSDAFRDFETDKIQYNSTVIDIFNMLKDTDFNDINVDILGDMYEELIKSQIGGHSRRSLGQFFTPSAIRKDMIEMLDIQGDEKIYDFAMGSGGFLLSAYEYLRNKGIKHKKIMKCLGGCEIQDKIFSLCCSNLLMITGSLPVNIRCDDSFLNPQCEEYDVVIANPPFGIKMNKNILDMIDDNFIPYKSSSSVMNFLQIAISLLKIGGRCAIIIPSGQELSSTSKIYVDVRRYLFHTCKVISLKSSNAKFKTTGVDTSILYFIKKSSEERDRPYKSKVYFDNVEVKTKTISHNSYSLSENTYYEDEIEEKDGYETYKLGDIISYLPIEKRNSKDGRKIKDDEYCYPLFYCSILNHLWLNEYDYEDEEAIMLNKTNGSGKCELFYCRKRYSVAQTTFRFTSDNDQIKTKYLYYYLKFNKNILEKLYEGINQKSITKERLNNVKVQIPSLCIQEKIVEECDRIYNQIQRCNDMIDDIDMNIKSYIIGILKKNGCNVMELNSVIVIQSGKYITKSSSNKGKYPVYGGGDISYYIDEYNRRSDYVISKDGVSERCVRKIKGKFFLNHHGWTFDVKDDNILKDYIGYWLLSNQDKIYKLAQGSAQKGINQKNFYSLKMSIPNIEIQKEIISFCDFQIKMKENLEQQISYLNELLYV